VSAPDFTALGDAFGQALERGFAAHLGTIVGPRMPMEPEPAREEESE